MGYYMAGARDTRAREWDDPQNPGQGMVWSHRRQAIDKTNPRALRRSLSRLKAFTKLATRAVHQVDRLKLKRHRRS